MLILFLTLFLIAFVGAAWHAWQSATVASLTPVEARSVFLYDAADGEASATILDGTHVLSAAHVMQDRKTGTPKYITLPDGKVRQIETVISDVARDMALFRVKGKPIPGYDPIRIDCSPPTVGEHIITHSQKADLAWKIRTEYLVASVDVIEKDPTAGFTDWIMLAGAPVLPGMSGSPAFSPEGNLRGLMIGFWSHTDYLPSPIGTLPITSPSGFGFMDDPRGICRFLDLHAPSSYVRADAPSAGSIDWRRAFGLAPKE